MGENGNVSNLTTLCENDEKPKFLYFYPDEQNFLEVGFLFYTDLKIEGEGFEEKVQLLYLIDYDKSKL